MYDDDASERDVKVFRANIEAALKDSKTRLLVNFVFELCGMYVADSEFLEFRNGERSVGLRLKALLDDIDPMIYVELQAERVRGDENNG